MSSAETDIAQLTYEQARAQLLDVVQLLEAGNQTLEESLETWERGEALARRCQAWLDGARDRLDRAKAARADATPESDPAEGES